MHFEIEVEREEDGRWIAEVPELPGVMAYGEDRASAIARVRALARRFLAERPEILRQAEAEVMEDIGLVRAIQAGEGTGAVQRDEVLRALGDRRRRP